MTEAEWDACADPMPMLEFLRGKTSERKIQLFMVACCHRIWDLLTDQRSRQAVDVAAACADGKADEPQWRTFAAAYGVGLHWAADYRDGDFYALNQVRYGAAARESARRLAALAAGAFGGLGNPALVCRRAMKARAAGNHALSPIVKALDEATELDRTMASSAARAVRHEYDALADAAWSAARAAERLAHAKLLRDIFGHHFHACSREPSWLAWNDGAIHKLAQVIYDDRALPAGTLDPARLAVLADALEDAGCADAGILGHCRRPGQHVRGCWVVDLLLGKD